MTTLTDLRPGVWVRLPDAAPDSLLSPWRRLVRVVEAGWPRWALTLHFDCGDPVPFHRDNLNLLETADTNPEEC